MPIMTTQDRLRLLAQAARAQGLGPFQFDAARQQAGLADDGSLHELALAWAQALPRDCRTLHDYLRKRHATAEDVADLLERAAELAGQPPGPQDGAAP